MREKLKSLVADEAFFLAVLLVLVAVVSFGLGRQSVSIKPDTVQSGGVIFTQKADILPPTPINMPDTLDTNADEVGERKVVASKSGSKYHLLTCPGASQIKEENKVYFATIAAAQAAGYTPAANCPGI